MFYIQDTTTTTTTTTKAPTTTKTKQASVVQAVVQVAGKCSAHSDCTGTSNHCVNGKCKCGANDKCTAASGKPFCGKTGTPATAAAASDGDTATCYVREYFLQIHFSCQ